MTVLDEFLPRNEYEQRTLKHVNVNNEKLKMNFFNRKQKETELNNYINSQNNELQKKEHIITNK